MSNEIQSRNSSSVDIENEVNHDLFCFRIIRKIKALKKLQFERLKVHKEFFREVFNLQMKFDERVEPIHEKRRAIIRGEYEPTQADCDFGMDEEEKLCEEFIEMLSIWENKPLNQTKGIPGFWLLVLKADEDTGDLIQPEDEPALQYLNDIKVIRSEGPTKLKIVFCFDSNEFFTNKELTKEYELSFTTDPKRIWSLSECVCVDRKGCEIDWKEGKDLTKKSRKIKNKTKGNKQSVVQYVKVKSFFNFFDNTSVGKDDNNAEEIEDELEDDWRIAQSIHKSLVPNAVLCLTGEIYGSESSEGSSDTSLSSCESSGESTDESSGRSSDE